MDLYCSEYTVYKKKEKPVWKSESQLVKKTDIEKRVTAGIIPDCRFRILLHVSGWFWIIEEQQSQAQLYSLQWNIWKHNSNVASSCTDKVERKECTLSSQQVYWLPDPFCWYKYRDYTTFSIKHVTENILQSQISIGVSVPSNNVFCPYLSWD